MQVTDYLGSKAKTFRFQRPILNLINKHKLPSEVALELHISEKGLWWPRVGFNHAENFTAR